MSNSTNLDFKPSTCRKCGNIIWIGISATSRCTVKLDTTRLNPIDEIQKLSTGMATYQIHRTALSFEATRRTAIRMKAKDPIVLATHQCQPMGLFATHPEYFNRPQMSESQEVPF